MDKVIYNMLIEKAKLTVEKFINIHGIENVAISFSGGKDSTVLLYLLRSIYPDIKAVFCNTGVEYNSILKFVKTFDNVEIIKPKYSFFQIIKKYGYPIISKEQSKYIYDVRNSKCKTLVERRLNYKGKFSISKKWMYLINSNFKISDKCCYFLKKAPLKKLKYKYFTGERIEEGSLRKQHLHTCILSYKCVPA